MELANNKKQLYWPEMLSREEALGERRGGPFGSALDGAVSRWWNVIETILNN